MFIDYTEVKIKQLITNNDCLEERVEIANNDRYAYPNKKYYYNIKVNNMIKGFHIDNGYSVTGIFESIKFTSRTFFDCSTFKNIIFVNCYFDKIDIRWCKFVNCRFINCAGKISYIRASTFKKDCVFKETIIEVEQIDEYMYLNSKRYRNDCVIQIK